MSIVRIVPAVLTFFILIESASAQQNRIACGQGMVEDLSPASKRSTIQRVAMTSDVVPIKFIGHATFVVRSPQDVVVVTDYNDYYRAGVRPDIATMNTDRGNHSTFRIEPGVAHMRFTARTAAEATLIRTSPIRTSAFTANLPTSRQWVTAIPTRPPSS